LSACARRLDGRPAAAATTRRKCAVLVNPFGYALERRLLPAGPRGAYYPASDASEPSSAVKLSSPAARLWVEIVRRVRR
jgi:hypothetical protein